MRLECNAEWGDSALENGRRSPTLTEPQGTYALTPTTDIQQGHHPLGQGVDPPTLDETRSIVQAWKGACPSLEKVRLPWWVSNGPGAGWQ